MTTKTLSILSITATPFLAGTSDAALIAAWDFQTTTNGGTAAAAAPATARVFQANFGSATLYLDGSNGSSSFFVPASGSTNTELNSFGGTALNADASIGMSTATSGTACLAILGGATSGGASAANGKSMVFVFSMANLANLSISYATQRTSTGFTSQVWEYSTDGQSWSSIGANTAIQSSFSTATAGVAVTSFAGITGLDGLQTAYVRMTVNGASASSGNNRLDNIIFSADVVPAPGAMALLGVAGLCANRRRR